MRAGLAACVLGSGSAAGPTSASTLRGPISGGGSGPHGRRRRFGTIVSSDPGSYPRRCSFARPSGSRPSRTAVLARRSIRRAPANERPLPEWTTGGALAACTSAGARRLVFVQRGNADTDELRAPIALERGRAGSTAACGCSWAIAQAASAVPMPIGFSPLAATKFPTGGRTSELRDPIVMKARAAKTRVARAQGAGSPDGRRLVLTR